MPKYKYKKAPSLERMEVWRHNSFIGCAVMMQKQALNIADAPTTTESAKSLAREIYTSAKALEQALRAGRKS